MKTLKLNKILLAATLLMCCFLAIEISPTQAQAKVTCVDNVDSWCLYRLYNLNTGEHFYTEDDTNERKKDIMAGWKDEGIAFYSDDNKGTKVYREYNPNAKTGTHNYTTNVNEHNYLISIGWKNEGIAFYGMGKNSGHNWVSKYYFPQKWRYSTMDYHMKEIICSRCHQKTSGTRPDYTYYSTVENPNSWVFNSNYPVYKINKNATTYSEFLTALKLKLPLSTSDAAYQAAVNRLKSKSVFAFWHFDFARFAGFTQ